MELETMKRRVPVHETRTRSVYASSYILHTVRSVLSVLHSITLNRTLEETFAFSQHSVSYTCTLH